MKREENGTKSVGGSCFSRLEAGLLVMVTVLFLYAPAASAKDTEEAPEFRWRTFELVQEFAGWLESALSPA